MTKLNKPLRLVLADGPNSWTVELRFPFHEGLKNYVKEQVVGSQWVPTLKVWWCPSEMVSQVVEAAARLKIQTVDKASPHPKLDLDRELDERLYPFQDLGVRRALQEGNWIFADETGLGKSCQAIITVQEARKRDL